MRESNRFSVSAFAVDDRQSSPKIESGQFSKDTREHTGDARIIKLAYHEEK